MEDDEAWLYGDDPSAEASAVVDVKKEDDVSISERHNFRYNIAGIIKPRGICTNTYLSL